MKPALLAALLAAGCSKGDLCERAQALWDEDLSGTCDLVAATPFYQTSCEDTVSVCRPADQEKVRQVFDCLDRLAPCVRGQEESWTAAASTCSALGAGISEECQSAVGKIGIGTECAQATDLMTSAMSAACAGLSSSCWYCDCANRGEIIDFASDGSFACTKAPASPAATACSGSALEAAHNCLADRATCARVMRDLAAEECAATSK